VGTWFVLMPLDSLLDLLMASDTIWDASYGENVGGLGAWMRAVADDTEVAAKDACILGADGLKRECSQLSVSFWNTARASLWLAST